MNIDSLVETVRQECQTPLSRLGSSKSLYAETGGEMEPETVLMATADSELAAGETYAAWAETESDEAVAATFETIAAEERSHYERVVSLLDGHEGSAEVPAVQAFLREQETTVPRLGAFVGRTLAAEKSKEQVTGFFVGQADPQTAQVIREIRADVAPQRERAISLLRDRCESPADLEMATESAIETIQRAYEAYTDQLETMGVNPKPVC